MEVHDDGDVGNRGASSNKVHPPLLMTVTLRSSLLLRPSLSCRQRRRRRTAQDGASNASNRSHLSDAQIKCCFTEESERLGRRCFPPKHRLVSYLLSRSGWLVSTRNVSKGRMRFDLQLTVPGGPSRNTGLTRQPRPQSNAGSLYRGAGKESTWVGAPFPSRRSRNQEEKVAGRVGAQQ